MQNRTRVHTADSIATGQVVSAPDGGCCCARHKPHACYGLCRAVSEALWFWGQSLRYGQCVYCNGASAWRSHSSLSALLHGTVLEWPCVGGDISRAARP